MQTRRQGPRRGRKDRGRGWNKDGQKAEARGGGSSKEETECEHRRRHKEERCARKTSEEMDRE